MTVSSTSNVKTYTGDNSTTAFSTVFSFFESSDIVVTLDGVTKTLDTDYTVLGGNGAIGTITFNTAPATDVAIIFQRVVAYDQQTDFANFDGNPADVTEKQFDLVVMQTQQLDDETNRSIKIPVGSSGISTDLPTPAADKALLWNSTGTKIINSTDDFNDIVTDATTQATNALSSASAAASSASSAASSASSAASSASDAADSAASINLPTLGSANQVLHVNSSGTDLEYGSLDSNSLGSGSVTNTQVAKTVITGQTDVTVATGDSFIYSDASDSGNLKKDTIQGIIDLATTAALNAAYPVGSYYMNETDSTNPATLLGFGTWSAVTDKFIVGRGSTFVSTGGSETDSITLSQANLPSSVTLSQSSVGDVNNSATGSVKIAASDSGARSLTYNVSLGSGTSFSVDTVPPYQAAYVWKRTA